MNVAFVTPFDLKSKLQQASLWHNPYLVSYFAARAIDDSPDIRVDYLSPKQNQDNAQIFRWKKKFHKRFFGRNYLAERDTLLLKKYSRQIAEQVDSLNPDVVFSSGTMGISYLDCKQPIVFWTDVPFAGLIDFYPKYQSLSKETIRQGVHAERSALERAKRVIYTSDWAAQIAISQYDVSPEKVHVVPRGANIESEPTLEDVRHFIATRPKGECRLIFLGKDWQRKGGDIAIAVAKYLNEAGLNTRLVIVGNEPQAGCDYPEFVEFTGFVSKSTPEGRDFLRQVISRSHFLLMPSRAETFGIVICEASAFGVPSLTSNVGGVPSAVQDDVNGKTFSLDEGSEAFGNYIIDLMADYRAYEALALSSYEDYQTRLNWRVIGKQLRQHIAESLG